MKWLLIATVLQSPVPTGLTYETLPECVQAAASAHQAWRDAFREAVRSNAPDEFVTILRLRAPTMTCIPGRLDARPPE
jgi:hypothetical protein